MNTTMKSVSIVRADLGNPAHADAIVNLIDEYARDPMGGGAAIPPATLSRIIPGLRAHPACLVWLAFDGEQPLGVTICFLGYSTFQAAPLINIHDVAVTTAARGRGIGRMLMNAVEAHARSIGCCKLTLEVRADNHVARGLYRDLGYSEVR